MSNKVAPTARHRQVAQDIVARGKTPQQALADAGYAPASSAHGMRTIRHIPALWRAVLDEVRKVGSLEQLTADVQERFVRNKLYQNAVMGEDAAIQSLKALGQDKRVAMWEPENQTGIILMQVPQALAPVEVVVTPLISPEET